MPKLSEMTGATVTGRNGKKVGMVVQVLFHPTEARVVGFEVRRPDFLFLLRRKTRFVPWPATSSVVSGEPISAERDRLLTPAQTSRRLGFDYEDTVIWRGMPVTDSSGRAVGTVKDVSVGRSSGVLRTLFVSAGTASDAAVGSTRVDAEFVRGFDGTSVQVSSKGFDQSKTTGGAAKIAGTGVAYATVRGEQVVDAVGEAAKNAGFDPRKAGRGAGRLVGKLRRVADKAMDDYEGRE
jgi:sporulation protein YlmC with PRC-barrel domain